MSDTNVGLGMVPHKATCGCDDCTIDNLQAKRREQDKRIAELEAGQQAAIDCAPVAWRTDNEDCGYMLWRDHSEAVLYVDEGEEPEPLYTADQVRATVQAENAELKQRLKNWNCGANSCTVYKLEEEVAEKDKRIAELEAELAEATDHCRQLSNSTHKNAAKCAELEAQSLDDARNIERLCKTIRYLQGIAEFGHGYMVPINEDEPVEQYVLNYVKRIEARIEQLKAENAKLQAKVRELEAENAALSDAEAKRFAAYEESERLQAENAKLRAKFTKLDQPKYSGDPMLDKWLETRNPEFTAEIDKLPPTYWARYDLSAVRIGWELALRQRAEQQDGREA